MNISTISIDLAKNVFQFDGFNQHHKREFNKRLSRTKFIEFMATTSPCRVVMEACYSSHYWGRTLTGYGHHVLLIPAQHVTPFVRGNKNDSNDALAIYEASLRPNIKFVPIKTQAQQEILALHKVRERLLQQRVAASNQLRGLLVDFGFVFPVGAKAFELGLSELEQRTDLSVILKGFVTDIHSEYKLLAKRIKAIEVILKAQVESDMNARILHSIPGIGVINASAYAASIDKAQAFNSPKEIGVWLGLTPRQYASGDKSKMSGITKRGNPYLRKQLIHGARALVTRSHKHNDALNLWVTQLRETKHFNCVVVATAHRLARLMWVLLHKQVMYNPNYLPNTVSEVSS
jgi:transposase